MTKKKVICIIPARGGSKGIKSKNLKFINGKPLIYYPIAAAKESKVCDHIFVSTDSAEIAKKAKRYGANVPFLRKKEFAMDLTTTEATLQNALLEYESFMNIKFDICVFLTANRIFRKAKWVSKCVKNLLDNKNIDSSFTVQKIYKHMWHKKNNKFQKVLPWMREYTSRQIAPELYREDTALACATRARFWRKGKRIGKNVKFVIHDDSFAEIDIHSIEDLFIAEQAMKFRLKYLKEKAF